MDKPDNAKQEARQAQENIAYQTVNATKTLREAIWQHVRRDGLSGASEKLEDVKAAIHGYIDIKKRHPSQVLDKGALVADKNILADIDKLMREYTTNSLSALAVGAEEPSKTVLLARIGVDLEAHMDVYNAAAKAAVAGTPAPAKAALATAAEITGEATVRAASSRNITVPAAPAPAPAKVATPVAAALAPAAPASAPVASAPAKAAEVVDFKAIDAMVEEVFIAEYKAAFLRDRNKSKSPEDVRSIINKVVDPEMLADMKEDLEESIEPINKSPAKAAENVVGSLRKSAAWLVSGENNKDITLEQGVERARAAYRAKASFAAINEVDDGSYRAADGVKRSYAELLKQSRGDAPAETVVVVKAPATTAEVAAPAKAAVAAKAEPLATAAEVLNEPAMRSALSKAASSAEPVGDLKASGYKVQNGHTLLKVVKDLQEKGALAQVGITNNPHPEKTLDLAMALILAKKNNIENIDYVQAGRTLVLPTSAEVHNGLAHLRQGLLSGKDVSYSKDVKGHKTSELVGDLSTPPTPAGQTPPKTTRTV